MRLGITVRLLLALAYLALLIPGAKADLFIRYLPPEIPDTSDKAQTDTGGALNASLSGEIRNNLDIYITGGRALLTGKGNSGQEYSLWFDGGSRIFRIFDNTRQGYFELHPNVFQNSKRLREGLRKALGNKLKNSPEKDHKKIIESSKRMEERVLGGAAPAEIPEYRDTEVQTRVGQYLCHKWEVISEDEKIRDLCVLTHSELGIDDKDWAVLKKMHHTGVSIAETADLGSRLIPRIVLDLGNGIPIEMRYFDQELNGKILRLTKFSRKKLNSKIVTGYAEYRRFPTPKRSVY